MHFTYDTEANKKATTIEVNSDLLDKAKAQKINLTAILEQSLKTKLAKIEERIHAEKASCITEDGSQCFNDKYGEF